MAAAVYIVTLSTTVREFRQRLRAIEGAAVVQELPHERVVVTLPGPALMPRLAGLEGVRAVVPDRLERPH
jgi:hypothetical protein